MRDKLAEIVRRYLKKELDLHNATFSGKTVLIILILIARSVSGRCLVKINRKGSEFDSWTDGRTDGQTDADNYRNPAAYAPRVNEKL